MNDLFKPEYGLVKYVNVNDTSAGFIYYNTLSDKSRFMVLKPDRSATLNLGPLPEDGEAIAKLLEYKLEK